MSLQRTSRRRSRDELLAPWIAGLVILGGWGLAARLIVPDRLQTMLPAAVEPAATPARSAAAPDSAAATEPDAAAVEALDTNGVAPAPAEPAPAEARPHASEPAPAPAIALDPDTSLDVQVLRARQLTLPVAGVERNELVSSFADARSGGRVHEALDILAPRGTPVVAVEAGTVAKLFSSVRGGITVYQFDPSGTYCYYYGHLDRYAPGLKEGARLEPGAIIGYVGTTGNAPVNTPHLHFAIFRLGPERQWWEGVPIDPFAVLR